MMRKLSVFSLALAVAGAASAHDLWLQPAAYWLPAPGSVPLSILVGHGQNRENWGIRSDRIVLLRSVGPDGRVTDLMPLVRPNTAPPTTTLRFAQPGTHVVAMQSSHAPSELPAARFNEYLKEEGLTPAIRLRQRTTATGRAGKEVYSRRAKALVQVGPLDPKAASPATRPLGLALEIVPEHDPYRLKPSEPLPVRVLHEGKPLPGALIKLTNLDADERPVATKVTDGAGRAQFSLPRKGKWLLNVVWTKPLSGNPKADFDTTFSSLSFGYPG